ncbi:hypothetical protein SAMN04487880_3541 [Marinobacter sp. es.042]|uniref:DUF7706 family protein n=1 Tax=Marinobacter sp. es.042 TaxID=1761794 RepID=UPI000B507566|nr:hypothetical protein [Marinobacter sp. es.042]SNB59295.1 hypothetical protein SAMN04487880_3541 [Marinobacter sp. es.042]
MNEHYEKVVCQFEIDQEAAAALALFLKRLAFEDWHEKTDPSQSLEDRIDQAYWMRKGCEAVERGLWKEGFQPR